MEAGIIAKTAENLAFKNASDDDTPHKQQTGMATENSCEKEEAMPTLVTDGSERASKDFKNQNPEDDVPISRNKRKRRRGKPKANSKPYKKSNWKFQMPRCRNGNGVRNKLVRSGCIVPYNTNKFLMEEHMAEVPSALLTPSGRTRDSSFSVDSEDNYFFSLPEDEEEFLTKEFANVYEKARVERLESMTKQQLIEECLQLEDRYSVQTSDNHQQDNAVDYMNKIRAQEERIRELAAENIELRRKLDAYQNNIRIQEERMSPNSSEDSESDSSSSSTSSSISSNLSGSIDSALIEEDSNVRTAKMDLNKVNPEENNYKDSINPLCDGDDICNSNVDSCSSESKESQYSTAFQCISHNY